MEIIKNTPPTILHSNTLDMKLLRLLLARYVVIVECKGGSVTYELMNK